MHYTRSSYIYQLRNNTHHQILLPSLIFSVFQCSSEVFLTCLQTMFELILCRTLTLRSCTRMVLIPDKLNLFPLAICCLSIQVCWNCLIIFQSNYSWWFCSSNQDHSMNTNLQDAQFFVGRYTFLYATTPAITLGSACYQSLSLPTLHSHYAAPVIE